MLSIRFDLLAGRLHATPWEAHVNEGQVEWPPSPWRLLRALVAASYRIPRREDAAVRALVSKLGDQAPEYRLPPVRTAHTRAYLAQYGEGGGKLVFDAFAVAAGRGGDASSLWALWPKLDLGPPELALLDELLAGIGYLGRAESWVLASRDEGPGEGMLAIPDPHGDVVLWGLCSEDQFEAWREGFLAGGGRAKDAPAGRFEALVMETAQVQKERWSTPPAVRRVRYRVESLLPSRRLPSASPSFGEVARYALVGPVLPPVARTVAIGDRVRVALMSRSRREDRTVPEVFAGKDSAGVRLDGNRHAYFLPCDDDGDGFLDHVLVWSPVGFEEEGATQALRTLRSLWADAGPDERYSLSLVAYGEAEALGEPERAEGRRDATRTAVLARARVWESETPFVPFRHVRPRPKDTVEAQVRTALSHLPQLRECEVEVEVAVDPAWSRRFLLERDGAGSRGGHRGYRLRLRFSEPVRGPIVLGYGAHYGLGLLRAKR